jgi:hypothetical protein
MSITYLRSLSFGVQGSSLRKDVQEDLERCHRLKCVNTHLWCSWSSRSLFTFSCGAHNNVYRGAPIQVRYGSRLQCCLVHFTAWVPSEGFSSAHCHTSYFLPSPPSQGKQTVCRHGAEVVKDPVKTCLAGCLMSVLVFCCMCVVCHGSQLARCECGRLVLYGSLVKVVLDLGVSPLRVEPSRCWW